MKEDSPGAPAHAFQAAPHPQSLPAAAPAPPGCAPVPLMLQQSDAEVRSPSPVPQSDTQLRSPSAMPQFEAKVRSPPPVPQYDATVLRLSEDGQGDARARSSKGGQSDASSSKDGRADARPRSPSKEGPLRSLSPIHSHDDSSSLFSGGGNDHTALVGHIAVSTASAVEAVVLRALEQFEKRLMQNFQPREMKTPSFEQFDMPLRTKQELPVQRQRRHSIAVANLTQRHSISEHGPDFAGLAGGASGNSASSLGPRENSKDSLSTSISFEAGLMQAPGGTLHDMPCGSPRVSSMGLDENASVDGVGGVSRHEDRRRTWSSNANAPGKKNRSSFNLPSITSLIPLGRRLSAISTTSSAFVSIAPSSTGSETETVQTELTQMPPRYERSERRTESVGSRQGRPSLLMLENMMAQNLMRGPNSGNMSTAGSGHDGSFPVSLMSSAYNSTGRRQSDASINQNSSAFSEFMAQSAPPREQSSRRSSGVSTVYNVYGEQQFVSAEEPSNLLDPQRVGRTWSVPGGNLFGERPSIFGERPSILNLQEIQNHRVSELLAEAGEDHDHFHGVACSLIWMYISGILPWAKGNDDGLSLHATKVWLSGLYRFVVLSLLGSVIALCLHQFMETENINNSCPLATGPGRGYCLQDALLPIMALGAGCFASLFSVLWQGVWAVGDNKAVLTNYALGQDLMECWAPIAYRDMAKMMCCWACVVGACVNLSFSWNLEGNGAILSVSAFAITTNIFASLLFGILHICRGLLLSLDNFCTEFVASQDCDASVHDWNVLQAMLRQVCHTVAPCYMMLLTGATVALLMPIIQQTSLWAMIPGSLALLTIFWVSTFIGEVTSKCDRVSVFVNMNESNENLDGRRQYLVTYITNSRAGFYMFDVRITAEMVVKSAYVGAVVTGAFTTARMPNV